MTGDSESVRRRWHRLPPVEQNCHVTARQLANRMLANCIAPASHPQMFAICRLVLQIGSRERSHVGKSRAKLDGEPVDPLLATSSRPPDADRLRTRCPNTGWVGPCRRFGWREYGLVEPATGDDREAGTVGRLAVQPAHHLSISTQRSPERSPGMPHATAPGEPDDSGEYWVRASTGPRPHRFFTRRVDRYQSVQHHVALT